jgi:Skp family chaperone for outer membrane proteins
MLTRRLACLAVLAGFLLPAAARAQDGTVKVAVCNAGKVFNDMDEKTALQNKLKNDAEKFTIWAKNTDAGIRELKKIAEGYMPESAQYKQKMEELNTAVLTFNVQVRMQEEKTNRETKESGYRLYGKIRDACKEIAEQKKIDLVLAERRPEIDIEKLTAEQVQQALSQMDVMYKNDKADITGAVTALLNKKYLEAGGTPSTQPAR